MSVVIPTLNESKNLPYVFERLPRDIFEVILVDGFSIDGTVEVAQSLYPTVRVIHQTERGKGNALACGFAACRGDIIVMLDADGSADPQEIPRFVEALCSGADFAKGSRFVSGGGSADITFIRAVGNWWLVRLANLLFGTGYTDLCYGYNAFWTRCLSTMNVNCNGFEVETLINVRIAKAGLRVVEVPSFEANRIHGVSNLRAVPDGWKVLKTILAERFKSHFALPPVQPGGAVVATLSWNGIERRAGPDRRRAVVPTAVERRKSADRRMLAQAARTPAGTTMSEPAVI